MLIGVLKEIKTRENRVAMVPAGVEQLRAHGHDVMVETGAGAGSVFADKDYVDAGATICPLPGTVYDSCDMIVKVKEPLPSEYSFNKKGSNCLYLFSLCSLFGTDQSDYRIRMHCGSL